MKKITLLFLAFIILVSCIQKKELAKNNMIQLLVGTYTSDSSEGIYSIDFNQEDGSLSNHTLIAKTKNPSYITKSSDGNFVYAVSENKPGEVSSFKWGNDRSALILISRESTMGEHPCYISLDSTESLLTVANYSSGNIAVYQTEDGRLDSIQIRKHEGSSVVKPNQNEPHAHCSKFSRDRKYIYVADLGIDEIVGYRLDENNQLGEKFTALKMDAGDGPRHFVYHTTKNIAYIINEFSNTVTVVKIDKETGLLSKIDKKSTLPDYFGGDSFGADIHISPDGKFLYASNRGHNSIAIFSVDKSGKITLIGTESVRGDWPRNFTLSPNGKFILVANQKTNNITVFERDFKTGLLAFTGVDFKISKPVCLLF